MLGTSLALSVDSPTDVDTNTITYDLRAADVGRSIYSVAGVSYPQEFTFEVAHKTDANGTKRHVVKVTDTRLDSLNVPGTVTMAFTITRGNNAAFTSAYLLQQAYRLIDFLIEGGAGANITKVLNEEV